MWRGLTNAQWAQVCVHLPTPRPSPRGGRPRADDRKCFDGILWVLWTGAPWSALPARYGSPATCWRRLHDWEADGTLLTLWRAFLAELHDRDKLRWDECFADGSFAPAKKGAAVGKTKRGKGAKWMVVVDGAGAPLGAHLDSASPHEVTLLERTLATIAVPRAHTPGRPRQRPARPIADRAYDSNGLRARLARRGIEPLFPAHPNHPNATHRDGRNLRRYRHRRILERTFAWLGTFRWLVVRHERLLVTYSGFFHLACAMLALRRVMK